VRDALAAVAADAGAGAATADAAGDTMDTIVPSMKAAGAVPPPSSQ